MSKKLVAYFSCSGITEKLAKKIAEKSGADLFEIKPQVPYTEADANWRNPLARCNKEKIGKKDVAIEKTVENIAEYDTIFLGFPIWYWNAPNVVITFVKQHDMSNKKIVLFATSGGSDLGKTAQTIEKYVAPSTAVKNGALINDMDEDAIERLITL